MIHFLLQKKRLTWALTVLPLMFFILFIGQSLWFSDSTLRGKDGHIFYTAGKVWLSGESPYSRESMSSEFSLSLVENNLSDNVDRGLFASPPTLAPLSIFLALFKWSDSVLILEMMNLIGFILVAFFCFSLVRYQNIAFSSKYLIFCFGVSGFVGAVEATMILGQLAVIALAGALGTVYAWRKQNVLLAVICILVAIWKPQVSYTLLLFVLCTGWIRPFVIAGIVVIFITFSVESAPGIFGLFDRYLDALEVYSNAPYNNDLSNKINVTAVFGNNSITGILYMLGIIAATASTIYMGLLNHPKFKSKSLNTVNGINTKWQFHILFCLLLSGAFIPLNSYDLVAVTACLMLSPILNKNIDRLALFGLTLACVAPHGIEHKLVTAATPIIGHVDGSVMQLLGGGSCLGLLIFLIYRSPWKIQ